MSPYTSMQQQAGLLPNMPQLPQVIFPGQITAMLAQGGPGAAMGAMGANQFPGQMYQTMTGAPQMYQGPTGIMQAQMAAAPFNPYPGPNPYAGMSGGAVGGSPSPFTAYAPAPPPAYGGFQGQGAIPFAPAQAAGAFNTPYSHGLDQLQAQNDRAFSMRQTFGGVAAHMGADIGGGMAGAALGSRFGKFGAIAGAAAGFLGMEFSGGGQFAQNAYMENVAAPSIQRRGMAGMIEHASHAFVPYGASSHASGSGFSHHASEQAASGLMAMGNSASFQRETFGKFNNADIGRITQSASHEGLMQGVQDPSQMVGRVREIAKSLGAFMELAKEPDIQRALSTMGSLRSSGLNLGETMGAVTHGRAFARMAGMSFQQMAETGGAMGSSTFQSMGLTQGLGLRTGMMHMGQAAASQNAGVLNPQMMNLVGGAQGLANSNNMFSAGMLQMPMMAPGAMSGAGGISVNAMNGMMNGSTNLFGMTGRGANVLSGMAARGGVESLGMAIGMQPILQDTMGRMMQADGPFTQRNTEDRQIMNLSRQLGMRGSAGFMTAGQAMGLSPSAALARAQEMGSGSYWSGQRQQIETRRREGREEEYRRWDAEAPTFGESAMRHSGLGEVTDNARRRIEDTTHHISHALTGDHYNGYAPVSDEDRRNDNRTLRSASFQTAMNRFSARGNEIENERERSPLGRTVRHMSRAWDLDRAAGNSALLRPFGMMANSLESEDSLRDQVRDYREGASLTGMSLSTTSRERQQLGSQSASLFGAGAAGQRAMQEFGQAQAQLMGQGHMEQTGGVGFAMNAIGRAGVMGLTGGMIDPGNVFAGSGGTRGSDQREAYLRIATTTGGLSNQEAARNWDAHSRSVTQSASLARHDSMTPEEEQRARDAARSGPGGGRQGGFEQATRESERAGVTTLMGSGASMEAGERVSRQLRSINGVGSTDAQRQRSREYIAARAQLVAVSRNSNSEEARLRARQQLAKFDEDMPTSGPEAFSEDQVRQMRESASALGSGLQGDALRDAERIHRRHGRASGSQLRAGFRVGEEQINQARLARTVSGGAEVLGSRGGVLGDMFHDMHGDNYNAGTMETRIRDMSDSQISQLRQQGQGSMADAFMRVRNSARGDTEAMGGVSAALSKAGERRDRIRTEVEEGYGGIGKIMNRFTHSRISDTVADLVGRTTLMDSDAERQESRTNEAQAAAQGAGLGGGNDQLVAASRSLEEASRMLRDTVQGRGLDGLVRTPGA